MKRVLVAMLCIIVFGSFNVSPKEFFVVLKKGDTLYGISREFDVPIEAILRVNNIDQNDVTELKPGLKIKIPVLHLVAKGDTLYGIAKQYEISLEELLEYNEIEQDDTLFVGQRIIVPHDISEEAEEDLLWPHVGKRETLQGKFIGVTIHGREGDSVISVSSGRVRWKGPYASYGRVVLIESEDGYIYGYGGNEKILVDVGDRVKIGTVISRLAVSTIEGEAMAYFFVYKNEQSVDPYSAPRK